MKKILLIEDNETMRENTAELLQLSGYEVQVAKDGKEGIASAKASIPDLIICDIMMPELDGYSVLHLLNKQSETSAIPFIFITAKNEWSDVRAGMNMGADDFLIKPFDDLDLLNAVECRLKKKDTIKKMNQPSTSGMEYDKEDIAFPDADLFKSYIIENFQSFGYKAKEVIYREGEYNHYLYMVDSGKVKTCRRNIDGKELVTCIYRKHDFFGYQSLIEERVNKEYASALTASKIRKIPKDQFLDMLHHKKEVADHFIKLMSEHLSSKDEELLRLAYSSVRKRLASKLLQLMGNSSKNKLSVSRTDLSKMIGTARETVVRLLAELRDSNIIATEGSQITITDIDKLKSLEQTA